MVNFANIAAQAAFQADRRREHDLAWSEAVSELASELQQPGAQFDPANAENVADAFADDLPATTAIQLSAALRQGDVGLVGTIVMAHTAVYCQNGAEIEAETRLRDEERNCDREVA